MLVTAELDGMEEKDRHQRSLHRPSPPLPGEVLDVIGPRWGGLGEQARASAKSTCLTAIQLYVLRHTYI